MECHAFELFRPQRIHDLMEHSILRRDQRAHLLIDRTQLLFRLHPADLILFVRILLLLAEQIADADTEKFIEIALEDRRKAKPFQQRILLALRLLQHTLIEPEP